MSKKQEAVKELFDGLISRYGDTPINRKAIKVHIKHMVRSKSRITVRDIDNLEKNIKATVQSPRLFNAEDFSPRQNRPKDEPILKHSKTPKVYRMTPLDKSKKLVNVRDLSIPGYTFETSPRGDLSLRSDFLNKVKLKHQNDEWGKIIKNDSVKFRQEQEFLRTQARLQQMNYFNDLFKQVCLKKQKNVVSKREQEMIEKEFVEKISNDVESKYKESQQMKMMKTNQEKYDMGNYLKTKTSQKLKNKEIKNIDKQNINNEILRFYSEEFESRVEKFKKLKEVASDNITSSSNLKNLKTTEKKIELQQDQEHMFTNAKNLNESESKYKKLVKEKRKKAHNIERLEKLLIVKPKNLKQLQEEDEFKEKLRINEIINEEKIISLKKLENRNKSKKTISGALERQISEKKLISEINKSLDIEQGIRNKLSDEKTALEDMQKLKRKKQLQAEMHDFYTRQVKEKLETEVSSFHLSTIEKDLNREIYNEVL